MYSYVNVDTSNYSKSIEILIEFMFNGVMALCFNQERKL